MLWFNIRSIFIQPLKNIVALSFQFRRLEETSCVSSVLSCRLDPYREPVSSVSFRQLHQLEKAVTDTTINKYLPIIQ